MRAIGPIPTELRAWWCDGKSQKGWEPGDLEKAGFYVAFQDGFKPIEGKVVLWAVDPVSCAGRLNTFAEAQRAVQSLAEAGITTDEALDALSDKEGLYLIYRDLFW